MDALRVLHVDDEPSFGDLVADFLEQEDDRIEVVTETDAANGLARLDSEQGRIDCIVSDYDMPDMDGLDLLDAVRDEHPDLPFILYTGKGSEEIASEAISKGATDYLQKEGGTEQYELLANRVRNVVEKHQSTQEAKRIRRQLQDITESTADCLWMFDSDWDELLFISGYEEVWGRPAEAIEENPRDFLEATHPDDREYVREAMGRMSSGESIDIEYRIRRGDDGTGWVWVKGEPLFDEDGSVERVVGFTRDITERKRRERELERHERIVENLPVGVFRSTTDGELMSVNRAFVSLFDADSKREILDTPAEELWADPGEREELLLEIQEVGSIVERALQLETMGGQRRWMEVTLTLTEENDDRYLDGIIRDITERRGRERIEKKFEKVFTTTRDAVFIADPERDEFIDCNPAAADLIGVSREAVCSGLAPSEVHPDGVMESLREFFDRVVEEGTGWTDEITILTVDGDVRPVEMSAAYLELDGRPCIVNSIRDITERKRRERRQREYLDTLDEIHEITTAADIPVEEKIEKGLEVATEYLDMPYGFLTDIEIRDTGTGMEGTQTIVEAIGSHDSLQPGESCPLSQSYCRRTIQQDGLFTIPDALEAGWDGDPGYERFELGSYIGGPLYLENEIYGTLCLADSEPRQHEFSEQEQTFVWFLTQWAQYELERERKRAAIEQQNEQFDELASAISHDLQTPLETARGRAELAIETGDMDHVKQALTALERVDELRQDIVEVLRSREIIDGIGPVDIHHIAEDVWELIEPPEGASLQVSDRPRVLGDGEALKRLLQNLLSNAIEHGGEEVTVRIGTTDGGFYVEDDGPGIPPEDRDRVFEPGYSTKEDSDGIGMPSARQIVLAHSWEIQIKDATALDGARFELTGVEPTG